MEDKHPRFVQVQNPRTGMYIKIDRKKGEIFHKITPGPYKHLPILFNIPKIKVDE